MPSKESLNKIDTKKNILTDKKHELQSLKDDVEGVARLSFQELISKIPDSRTDKKIYQTQIGNKRLEFYGNGRVNIIKPNQKAPDMHNRSKQYSTIYIDNQPIDLEKGRYVWEDKETDKRMSVLCMDYIRLFHEKNSDAHISDGQLRNRFYNLFKNWYPDEYKIRELGPDTRGKIAKKLNEIVNGGRYRAHYFAGTMYINSLESFFSEVSHHFNGDGNWIAGIEKAIDVVSTGFDNLATYDKQGTIEFFAHSVTEPAIKSYLMILPGSEDALQDSFDTVLENYYEANNKLYVLNDEYKSLDLSLIEYLCLPNTPYVFVRDQRCLSQWIQEAKKDILDNEAIPASQKKLKVIHYFQKKFALHKKE